MQIPKLKRVKVSSEGELRRWLSRDDQATRDVMIVTCNKRSVAKHVPTATIEATLGAFGWQAGARYTLDGNLVGHVAHRA